MTTMSKRKKKNGKTATDADKATLQAALAAARGSLAWVKYSVADFLQEKREEARRENGE